MFFFFGFITLTLLIIFLFFYIKDPRRIIKNGFLFNMFFCSLLVFCLYLLVKANNPNIRPFITMPLVLLFMLPFGIIALIVGLFQCKNTNMRKEGRRFSNCLTLILGIFILLFLIIPIINPASFFLSAFPAYFRCNISYYFLFLYTLIKFLNRLFPLSIQQTKT